MVNHRFFSKALDTLLKALEEGLKAKALEEGLL